MLTHRAFLQVHLFHITDNDTRLTWMSKDNRNRSINVNDIKNVRICMLVSTSNSRIPACCGGCPARNDGNL
jgi:hypothetical protein